MIKVESEGTVNVGSSTNSEDSGYDNGFLEDVSTSSESSGCYQQMCVSDDTSTGKSSAKNRHKCSLEVYDISENSIETISSRTFQYYANYLKELDLSTNKISSLPETICDLKCLKVLNLSHNKFESVPASWKKLHQLKVLNLSHNQLVEAPPCLELGMERLVSIDLSHNAISSFRSPMCLPFLQELSLRSNAFRTLPLWLFSDQCRSLKELDVSFNFCFDDPKLDINIYVSKHYRTSSLKTVRKLNISNIGANLDMVSILSHFESLQNLYMGNSEEKDSTFNNFCEISMSIFCNPRTITELYIPKVGLAGVPDDFCKLESLRILDLSHNRLDWLPETFGELKNLQELILTDCNLSYLPDSFVQLTSVTKLLLNENQLTDVNQLSRLTSLQWLDLYDNLLDEFPISPELLTSPQLEGFDVAANFIDVQKPDVLEESLRTVYYQLQATLRESGPNIYRQDNCKFQNLISERSSFSGSFSSSDYEESSTLGDYNNEVAEPYIEVDEENWDDDSSDGDDEFDPNLAVERWCLFPPGKYKFGWTPPIRRRQECIVPSALQIKGFIYVPGQVHTKTTRCRQNKINQLPVAEGQFDDQQHHSC